MVSGKIKLEIVFCVIVGLILFAFFLHTLNYEWKHFDEQIIYSETVLPIAGSFDQIFEYISNLGLFNYFEASNPFYSTVSNLRCDPINTFITLFIFYLFNKNAFAYHLFSLSLHVINSCLLFLILNEVSKKYFNENEKTRVMKPILITFLTLLWSLHPINVESILFTCNWSSVLTYFLCTLLLFLFVKTFQSKSTLINSLMLFVLFLIPLFNSEYAITLPIILFFYTFISLRQDNSLFVSFMNSIKKNIPFLFGLGIFLVFFFITPIKINLINNSSLELTLQRIFWFTPQVFFHYIKLIFLPIHLSIDQTMMVNFSKTLIEPYALFCIAFFYLLLSSLIISLFFLKKNPFYFFFVSLFSFLVSLLPFLHIISPIYCVLSERYLYFPLMMLIFGGSHVIFYFASKNITIQKIIITGLLIVLPFMGVKTYIRTLDWQNSISLFSSSLKEAPNDLFKGLRTEFIGTLLTFEVSDQKLKEKGREYLKNGLNILETSIKKSEKKESGDGDRIPKIIKFYGLDPHTLQAKSAYLLAFTKFGLFRDPKGAYESLSPFIKDLNLQDTQILDLYLTLLFTSNRLDEAEDILNEVSKVKLNPTILIAQATLERHKYNNYLNAEKYLKEAFKYFPYDPQTLSNLKSLYLSLNKKEEYAYFSYLHGLRTHSESSLNDALAAYKESNNPGMTKKVLKSLILN